MKKSVESPFAWIVVFSLTMFGFVPHALAGPAADVLKLYGRGQGLCVVIGCGSQATPALAAELASAAPVVVHGIALDDPSLLRAQAAVDAAGVQGLATVERLPLAPLPYRDNLANLVVVEDAEAATKAGLAKEEALRVLAPGGTLLTRSGGTWDAAVKPWPKEMDEWTHESHGPDGNCVSNDTVVKFPVGYRWHAGLPMNLQHPKQTANAWSSTRGMAVAGGRCFTLSNSILENLGPTYDSPHGLDQFVTARDAFNGLFLWRRNLGATYYGGLFYPNRAPFAAVGDRVYAATGDGKLLALDAATGDVVRTFDTASAPGEILLDGGVLVAATWKDGTQVGGIHGVDRRSMTFGVADGTVEAFDAAGGKRLWSVDKLATSIRSADGIVYLAVREGADRREELAGKPDKDGKVPPRPKQSVAAVDLRSGKVLWTVGPDVLGTEDSLRLDVAGLGVVAVSHDNGAKTTVLSAKDGKVVLQTAANSYAAFYDGALQIGPKQYDPATGQEKGRSVFSLGSTICTPRYFVNNIIVANRGCGFQVDGKPASYSGARGGCLFASIPAYGEFYTPQNWCRCAPSQIEGFIAFGPIAGEPTPEAMEAAPPVENGPALGSLSGETKPGDWPMYRHDAGRTSAASSEAPGQLDVLWQAAICPAAPAGVVGMTWKERLTDALTAPSVAEGIAVVAASDRHQVIALDAATGKPSWRQTVGARVDTSPTIHGGACLFGANDGYVYAISARDGRLAWRMRAAPRDERMVSYGQIESPWPVISTVLVADGVGYASAGRSQGSDGGIVVRAFEPATGKVLWSKAIGHQQGRAMRLNDLMLRSGDSVQLMIARFDPKTGAPKPNPTNEFQSSRKPSEAPAVDEIAPSTGLEGFASPNWTRLGNRKSISMAFGNVQGDLVSWGDKAVCAYTDRTRGLQVVRRDAVGSVSAKRDPKGVAWNQSLPKECQATAVIVCPNAVVVGGGIYADGRENAKGFVRVMSIDAGSTVADETLPAPLAYGGLAVADGRIYATLADGSARCLGKRGP